MTSRLDVCPRRRAAPLVAALALAACRPAQPTAPPGAPPSAASAGSAQPAQPATSATAPLPDAPVARPTHLLTRKEAEAYGLALVNQDRARAGKPPLTWDATAAAAAERHVRDMARGGFTAHWGSDGSVPEQRYTEARGEDLVTENAACYGDGRPRDAAVEGPFDPAGIEEFQRAFMAEVAPMDGHKRNILEARHTGLGLAFATAPGSRIVCVAQEFVDDYGSYEALPAKAKLGTVVKVSGELRGPAKFGGVGVADAPWPAARTPAELLKTGGYSMPSPRVSYFPKGFKTPKPVALEGARFSIELPLDGEPGLREIQVFAKFPGDGDALRAVSIRTILVDR